jgi:hypothetical protein
MPSSLSILRVRSGVARRTAVAVLCVLGFSAKLSLAQPSPPEPPNTVGVCPAGTTQVNITTASQLQDAAGGDGAYASNPPNTCYMIANGTYALSGSGVLLYIQRGGTAPVGRHFVGASRHGVVIRGRATVESGVSNVSIRNLTITLTGYSQSGAFATLTVNEATNVTVSQVTFTGDCNTGLRGGHVETDNVNGLVVDASLIEKFGHCSSGGHEDHGMYFASGSNITVSNSIIRNNSSRGIQLYTGGGDYGTLTNVTIRNNWIYLNGHANYEDGIVVNATDTGTVTNLLIERNLIYRNFFSGIRFVGDALANVSILYNTFDNNGVGSSSTARSEINLDDSGSGANTTLRRNIFNAGNRLINSCYSSAGSGFMFTDNVLNGQSAPSGQAQCVGSLVVANPQFVNAAVGDYHTLNPVVAGYGVYAGLAPLLAIQNVSATEGTGAAGTATFMVTLAPSSAQTVTVSYATANGTALAGTDYTAASGVVTFPPGSVSQPIVVSLAGDALDEPDETFVVNLAAPSGATLADGQGVGTIVDDDPQPTIAVTDASVFEGNSGTSAATFTLGLSAPSGRPITVAFATAPGTATAGSDYVSYSGTASFPPGTTTRPVSVVVNGDYVFEPDETFTVNLSSPTFVTIGDGQGAGTITNDDNEGLTIADLAIVEPPTGTRVATFTVTLAPTSAGTVTVDYATAPGSATAGSDYDSVSGSLTFTPGLSTRPVSVMIRSDAAEEGSETFFVNLTNASGAPIARSQATGSVFDPGAFFTLVPCRVLDTRNPNGPYGGPVLAANSTRNVALAGQCGLPAAARAVSLNVTVTGATAAGNLRLFPAGTALPLAATLNYAPGLTRANNTVVGLSAAGLAIRAVQAAGTSAHVIIDVNGYFE